ncbi:hypothetical protein CDCA_CDCA11G3156 [Cyanidium caldarium]|uniref:Ketoreductase domain-containing protein n=1 Tax=Cyanidium caldarium TaxID=2771 RepID=A0AAV9IYG1_CYACA|nr:hypothetical protein CDCA_CDCA11G3156 [Cyanidium caldarium]
MPRVHTRSAGRAERAAPPADGAPRHHSSAAPTLRASPGRTAVVIGGCGFLGKHLVGALRNQGVRVVVLDVRLFLIDEWLDAVRGAGPPPTVISAVVDIADAAQVQQAFAQHGPVDVVFHCASAAPTAAKAANRAVMERVNVRGTQNILDACRAHRVSYLVYTSSASVVFGGRDLVDVDEQSVTYPRRDVDFYTRTKRVAEQLVLEAATMERHRAADRTAAPLWAVALRPSGIFGEGDPLFVPTLVDKARRGRMKFVIGSGRNLMDWTYVGNVVQAHVLAADTMMRSTRGAQRLSGRAYFITNNEPRPFWGFMGDVLEGLGYPRPHIHLPFALVYPLSWLVSVLAVALAVVGIRLDTDFTPSRILLATCERRMRCAAAERDFGYRPQVKMDEALRRTVAWFRRKREHASDGPRKKKRA